MRVCVCVCVCVCVGVGVCPQIGRFHPQGAAPCSSTSDGTSGRIVPFPGCWEASGGTGCAEPLSSSAGNELHSTYRYAYWQRRGDCLSCKHRQVFDEPGCWVSWRSNLGQSSRPYCQSSGAMETIGCRGAHHYACRGG